MKMAMQIGERDVSTRPRLQDHNSGANRRRGKYAEVTSIRLKYCEGSTRFKGHLGIHVGEGGGGAARKAESEHFSTAQLTSGRPL